jgi:hypothetical protein
MELWKFYDFTPSLNIYELTCWITLRKFSEVPQKPLVLDLAFKKNRVKSYFNVIGKKL